MAGWPCHNHVLPCHIGQAGCGGCLIAAVRPCPQVVCGTLHTLALLDDGTVAACGDNEWGQTGLEASGTQVGATAWVGVAGVLLVMPAARPPPSLVLLHSAPWVGVSPVAPSPCQANPTPCRPQVELPRVVKELRGMHVVRLAAGASHTLALSSTGGVFSCGNGAFGQLGRDTSKGGRAAWGGFGLHSSWAGDPGAATPLLVYTRLLVPMPAGTEVLRPLSRLWPLGVVQVAAGENHSAALLVDGRVLTWVRQLGWLRQQVQCLRLCYAGAGSAMHGMA